MGIVIESKPEIQSEELTEKDLERSEELCSKILLLLNEQLKNSCPGSDNYRDLEIVRVAITMTIVDYCNQSCSNRLCALNKIYKEALSRILLNGLDQDI